MEMKEENTDDEQKKKQEKKNEKKKTEQKKVQKQEPDSQSTATEYKRIAKEQGTPDEPKQNGEKKKHETSSVSIIDDSDKDYHSDDGDGDVVVSVKEHVGVGKISSPEDYYHVKFFDVEEPTECVDELCSLYLQGVMWTLHYYFQGVPSWSWYYKHYAAPLPSDLVEFYEGDFAFSFPKTEPLHPIEQLFCVLPVESSPLLPKPMRPLMTQKLKKYFPDEYPCIPDVHSREWRDVVVIPVVDDAVVQEEFSTLMSENKFTEKELARNARSAPLLFKFSKDVSSDNPAPTKYLKSKPAHCSVSELQLPEIVGGLFQPRVLVGCNTGTTQPPASYPTLKFLKFEATHTANGASPLGFKTKLPSVCINVDDGKMIMEEGETKEEFAQRQENKKRAVVNSIVNNVCAFGYPFPAEGKVVKAFDSKHEYSYDKYKNNVRTRKFDFFEDMKQKLKEKYLKLAVNVGDVELIVEAAPLEGLKLNSNFEFEPFFKFHSEDLVQVPVQLLTNVRYRKDERYDVQEGKVPISLFSTSKRVVVARDQLFGRSGTIIQDYGNGNTFRIRCVPSLTDDALSALVKTGEHLAKFSTKLYRLHDAATAAAVTRDAFARLTSSVFVDIEDDRVANIGLGLRSNRKQLYSPGYTVYTKVPQQNRYEWKYTDATVSAIKDYKRKFPEVFDAMKKDFQKSVDVHTIFPSNTIARVDQLLEYLSNLESTSVPLVSTQTQTFNSDALVELEQCIRKHAGQMCGPTEGDFNREELVPAIPDNTMPPWQNTLRLGDVVVKVGYLGPVPFGLTGNVIEISGDNIDVMFHKPFLSGSNMHGRVQQFSCFRLHYSMLMSLSCKPECVTSRAASNRGGGKKNKKKKKKTKKNKPSGDTNNPFAALAG
eukprot:m.55134 g.55134  ORF g.55134 m.55134 type:complete len:880 (+) comp11117_c0_seq1:3-2642(+)